MTVPAPVVVPPLVRLLRTVGQLVVAFPILVPIIVAVLRLFGVESITEPWLLGIAGLAMAAVVAIQNFAEKAGLIPTIGGQSSTGSDSTPPEFA